MTVPMEKFDAKRSYAELLKLKGAEMVESSVEKKSQIMATSPIKKERANSENSKLGSEEFEVAECAEEIKASLRDEEEWPAPSATLTSEPGSAASSPKSESVQESNTRSPSPKNKKAKGKWIPMVVDFNSPHPKERSSTRRRPFPEEMSREKPFGSHKQEVSIDEDPSAFFLQDQSTQAHTSQSGYQSSRRYPRQGYRYRSKPLPHQSEGGDLASPSNNTQIQGSRPSTHYGNQQFQFNSRGRRPNRGNSNSHRGGSRSSQYSQNSQYSFPNVAPPFYFGGPGLPIAVPSVMNSGQYPPHFIAVPAFPPTGSISDPETLKNMILFQVEYYLSVENLIRDIYLRRHMDKDGFLPLSFIASFNRIKCLTTDPQIIKESLIGSTLVELDFENNKIRPRENPLFWVLKNTDSDIIVTGNESCSSTLVDANEEADRKRDGEFPLKYEDAEMREVTKKLEEVCIVRGQQEGNISIAAPANSAPIHSTSSHQVQ